MCQGCGEVHYSYHSCRDRHCPKCQNDKIDDWLEKQYDLIIFDSSPLIAVTDPILLASMTDGLLIVIKFASTSKWLVEDALGRLENVKTGFTGAILNGIEYPGLFGYYKYNYYYYYHYHYDYSSNGKKKRKKRKKKNVTDA